MWVTFADNGRRFYSMQLRKSREGWDDKVLERLGSTWVDMLNNVSVSVEIDRKRVDRNKFKAAIKDIGGFNKTVDLERHLKREFA